MTERQQEAADNKTYSRAFRRAVRAFAKLKPEDAQFEVRLLALLFTEEIPRDL